MKQKSGEGKPKKNDFRVYLSSFYSITWNLNIFKERKIDRLKSIHRALISLISGALAYFLVQFLDLPVMIHLLVGWVSFCLCYLVLCWYVIYTTSVDYIVKKAADDDGSRAFVFLFILIACFGCFAAVLSIVVNAKTTNVSPWLQLPLSIAGMVVSWLLVHTLYIFHYAHLYYKKGIPGEGLNFPDDAPPNYLVFAYYSLCMGCTFQVSDVDTTSKSIRTITMYHGLISFALNTFVVALTINIVSGLVN